MTEPGTRAFVLRPGEGRDIDMGNFRMSLKAYIPAGIPHGFRVGPMPSRKLNIYAPAAMVGYFDELAAAIARDEMDPDTLTEMAKRYGMEVIGPVPEGYV